VGATICRAAFTAVGAEYYRDTIDVALELGRPTEAFNVQERYRGRALLAMLAERDLLFSADVPPEISRERRVIDTEYDRTVDALSKLGPEKKGDADRLRQRIREIGTRRDQLIATIRGLSPRLAALQYPEPLDLRAASASLDPGTLLLAFWTGPKETRVFAVRAASDSAGGPALTVATIALTEIRLRGLIRRYRDAIQADATTGGADRAVGGLVTRRPALKSLDRDGERLFSLLFGPVAALIAKSTRVLIVPDGPLHLLPFAALRIPGRTSTPSRYLVEWKPLHVVLSATLYAEERALRRGTKDHRVSLVAFGDPDLSMATPRPVGASETTVPRRALELVPLPATRREVESIAKLFPNPVVYVGADATEERAKSIDASTEFVHFATHAILDEQLPLNSALVLSVPVTRGDDQQNGLLQVWEIFDRLRINATLVTLSACETGLGQELRGEGLIGLTRAFQFAGAQSVLASLWSVADDSTASLMTRFYRYLRGGRSKDEALRAAQMDVIRSGGKASRPFHWAAFELFGDWQ